MDKECSGVFPLRIYFLKIKDELEQKKVGEFFQGAVLLKIREELILANVYNCTLMFPIQ
jgi:hypothetical protein